jgi:hypothetical protein
VLISSSKKSLDVVSLVRTGVRSVLSVASF